MLIFHRPGLNYNSSVKDKVSQSRGQRSDGYMPDVHLQTSPSEGPVLPDAWSPAVLVDSVPPEVDTHCTSHLWFNLCEM